MQDAALYQRGPRASRAERSSTWPVASAEPRISKQRSTSTAEGSICTHTGYESADVIYGMEWLGRWIKSKRTELMQAVQI
jgi:hypothetical protein